MFHRFRYEADIYPALTRIPLHVRMKLDLIGAKISLKDWLAFGLEERIVLCHLPVDLEEEKLVFRAHLDFLSRKYRGDPLMTIAPLSAALWDNVTQVPKPVVERSIEKRNQVTLEEWARWKVHQRYALYKTAISKNDPEQFFAVLDELREQTD